MMAPLASIVYYIVAAFTLGSVDAELICVVHGFGEVIQGSDLYLPPSLGS